MKAAQQAMLWRTLFQLRPDYQLTANLFLRLLAVIYFIAFASLFGQMAGLVGPDGILPFDRVLERAYQQDGWQAWLTLPNLFWFNASDLALQSAAVAGCIFSVLLFLGRLEQLATIALFVLYLSLFHAGQLFLSFQWDSLLLEAGFLAIFLISGPSLLLILLYEWLLFRFRFMSGLAKLLSDDPSWASFTALHHYFETQPLPHIGSWYAHYLPHWLHQFGVGFTLFTELLVPFLIFMPRPYRIAAALITILMQLLLIATSNHAYVNLLVILLCVLLLDDRIISRLLPRKLLQWINKGSREPGLLKSGLALISGLLIVFVSTTAFYMYATRSLLPEPIIKIDDSVQLWGIGHIYHVFPTMQTTRQELLIQGSDDGQNWRDYEFKFKPGKVNRQPAFIVPYHPRLDWMMWFVPSQSGRQLYWFREFQSQLRKGSPQVLSLLKNNPFPVKPPRFLRVQAYDYRFTTAEQRKQSGDWWRREYLGLFPYVAPRRP
ncbi:lipase maturation factor family protein [Methylophaga sp. OBS4]|uniref:lipase maturation factor family protein n=1 Tax=Methylophaga sp. OBS4 TaxID=2991935 RepID=UPI00224ED1BB|nr:lipase maturation factor family protein [Methylophaga sp. OBS4]MCX4186471.1 lipase maturation factor family protein [Methylophaga sp. OBS4]